VDRTESDSKGIEQEGPNIDADLVETIQTGQKTTVTPILSAQMLKPCHGMRKPYPHKEQMMSPRACKDSYPHAKVQEARKEIVQVTFSLKHLPKFPECQWMVILWNSCVDYSTVFTFINTNIQEPEEGHKIGGAVTLFNAHTFQKKSKKTALTASEWFDAHCLVTNAICVLYSHCQEELQWYSSHIGGKFRLIVNPVIVLAYNEHVRQDYSVKNQYTLDNFNAYINTTNSYPSPL
jgi:hypothetical protein